MFSSKPIFSQCLSLKYSIFFNQTNRKAEEGKNLDNEMPRITQTVFDDLFKGELFSNEKIGYVGCGIFVYEEKGGKSYMLTETGNKNMFRTEQSCR